MGRKAKYTFEQKVQACKDYLSGQKSAKEIGAELSMGKNGERSVLSWAKQYRANGPGILQARQTNAAYSKEFKIQVVEEYLSSSASIEGLAVKYGIDHVDK